jgi:hypothetical protein
VIHGQAHVGHVTAVRGDSPAGPDDLSVEDDMVVRTPIRKAYASTRGRPLVHARGRASRLAPVLQGQGAQVRG